ncbi:ECF transporter S component [Vaginisenegalia massiliensis]|uniref:ECF transporter S component n=1 Tax=Vaginisenegalia massiliensis TaxID=2058294 RepID=UPI000F52E69B|nr:ECF transporter S component [Vaginisenegalia massiliensis]
MKKMTIRHLVLLAILGAWAIILRLFNFPILPAAPFLKVDFSDLMVTLGLLIQGPLGAASVAFIRDGLGYLIKGGEAGLPIGETMSFIASLAYILPLHFIFKRDNLSVRKLSHYIWACMVAIMSLVLVMGLLNYFVALPLYIKVLNFPIASIKDYVLAFILPFNLLKGLLVSFAQYLLFRLLGQQLVKRQYIDNQYQQLFDND